MALSANTLRSIEDPSNFVNTFGVKASAVIFLGAAIGSSGGYARPLNAGDKFLGFALEPKTGTSADGGETIQVRTVGRVQLAVTSVAVTDIGKAVYASDDGTFTLTATGNSFVGVVHRFVSAGIAIVDFNASRGGGSGITTLTDNSAGTANDTLEALTSGTTYSSDVAAIRNNFADLAAKINQIIKAIS